MIEREDDMWERDEHGNFRAEQRQLIYDMYVEGKTKKQISKIAKCSESGVRHIVKAFSKKNNHPAEQKITKVDFCRQHIAEHGITSHERCQKDFGNVISKSTYSKACLESRRKKTKPKMVHVLPTPKNGGAETKPSPTDEIKNYYNWVIKGLTSHIGDKSFLDQMIEDRESGAFE